MNDAKLWKNLLMAISTLIEEADFKATPDGIMLRSMDPSHVAMVDFEWQRSAFADYTCLQPTKIRLNLMNMLKLLKRVASEESLTIVYNEDTRKITMTLKARLTRKFTIPTLEASDEEVPTPKISFDSTVKLSAATLRDILEDIQAVSDNVRFETTEDRFIAAATTELSSASIEMDKGTEVLLDLQCRKPSKATYSLNYLGEIARAAASTSEVVTLEFSTNMPIKLQFEIAQGQLLYYLAPRIEAE
jgi:proliferating cell nuclear antigen